MNEKPHQAVASELSHDQHEQLINRYTHLQGDLARLIEQRELSDETAHTEELMEGSEINEKFIDRGWTAQIEETEAELKVIEDRIAEHIESIPRKDTQPELDI